MPRGDGTGPLGMGPMTGRAAGYCAGYSVPGFMNPIPGGGRGMAWGRGGGFGRGLARGFRGGRGPMGVPPAAAYGGYPPPPPPNYGYAPYAQAPAYGPGNPYGNPEAQQQTAEQEVEMLKSQAEYLQDMLEGIQNRISELEGTNEKKQENQEQ